MFRRLLKNFIDHPEYVKLYIIPSLLFLFDFFLRVIIGVDIIDAGADMALLAVATFIAIFTEDTKNHQKYIPIIIVFIIIFLILWILCLKIISFQKPITFSFLESFDFRIFLSWFFGLVSLIIAGIVANEILYETSKPI